MIEGLIRGLLFVVLMYVFAIGMAATACTAVACWRECQVFGTAFAGLLFLGCTTGFLVVLTV